MISQVQDLPVAGKKVLLRVDFNVPLGKDGSITDDTRIKAAIPTIENIINRGGKVILLSHLGRPKGKDSKYSLKPCAERLSELIKKPVTFVSDCIGDVVEKAVAEMKNGDVLLLENLRFYDAEEHPEKDPSFVKKLASYGDMYVNDAFGTAHRAHASTAVLASFFPHAKASGLLMMKEVEALSTSLSHPTRPFVSIIGGAKISTKLGVLRSLLQKVDTLLIGGAMTYTFMKAQGISIGDSPFELEMEKEALFLLGEAQKLSKKILLPIDLVVAKAFSNDAASKIILVHDGIPEGYQGMDIGPKTIESWAPIIQAAQTIFWNGPLGVYEFPVFAVGTEKIAKKVAENRQAFSVVGGGDSIAALEKNGLASQISHISTGGGASMEFLEQGTLPGLDALQEKGE